MNAPRSPVVAVLALAGALCASPLLPTQLPSLGAGGTGVVTSDGIAALLANPARLGLAGIEVGMDGNAPREKGGWEASYTVLARNPGKISSTVLDHQSSLRQRNLDTVLARDPELFDLLWDFNRQAVSLRQEFRLDLQRPQWAATAWMLGDFGVLAKHGELYPSGRIADTLSWGMQVGGSQTLIRHELMVGVALKSLWATSWDFEASSQAGMETRDTLIAQGRREFTMENLEWVAGFDLGVLWLPVPQVQLGSSLRDVGMRYREQFLTPAWDLGAAWLPAGFQQGGAFPSHLALAVSLVDVLDAQQSWKPLSKIGMGADYSFSVLPWKALNFRLSVGALGGYPTAGIGIDIVRAVRLDMTTWAREAGWYTGQMPDRKWALKAAVGW
jgi:hypothetical protein